LAEAERVVLRHMQEIIDAWNKHFRHPDLGLSLFPVAGA
jgi:hypothetical protein